MQEERSHDMAWLLLSAKSETSGIHIYQLASDAGGRDTPLGPPRSALPHDLLTVKS